MCKSRATVPRLNLIPEDDLYLAFVFTTDVDQWLYELVNGYRKLPTDYEKKEISRCERL